MKMRALDTLFISSLGPDNILPNAEFEVSDEQGKDLEDRGLAKRVAAKAEAKAEKAAPENKMQAAPTNKAAKPVARTAKKKGK